MLLQGVHDATKLAKQIDRKKLSNLYRALFLLNAKGTFRERFMQDRVLLKLGIFEIIADYIINSTLTRHSEGQTGSAG